MSSTYFGSIITYKYMSEENEGGEREGKVQEKTRALWNTYMYMG